MERRQFRSKVSYDLGTLREMNVGGLYIGRHGTATFVITIWMILCYMLWLWIDSDSFYSYFIPLFFAAYVGIKLYEIYGKRYYKRLVVENGGAEPKYVQTFDENGINFLNVIQDSKRTYSYSAVRRIGETKNLLLLIMEQELILVVDKRTLEGGTSEELIDYLFVKCANLKKKKLYTRKRLYVRGAVLGVLMLLAVGTTVWTAVNDDYSYPAYLDDWYFEPYLWANHLTGEELAARFEKLGIEGFDEEMVMNLEDYWSEFEDEDLYYMDKVADVLWNLGMGEFDEETGDFTPSSQDVYAADVEYFYTDYMYTEFLTGIAALGEGELDFTDISENLDDVDWDAGRGTRTVSFTWEDERYTIEAEVWDDWFDVSVANELNDIIAQNNDSDKRLYFGYDGYQWLFVFYCDRAWADEFQKTTGMWLMDELTGDFEEAFDDGFFGTHILTAVM